MQWIFEQRGVATVIHYLDDFLLLGAPESAECQEALRTALEWCRRLGILIAVHKTEGPSWDCHHFSWDRARYSPDAGKTPEGEVGKTER